jgi:transcriptional regulator with XRE-family HTH domain
MRQKGVGACHRELGARLRELRKAAGLTGRELASRIGWSEAKVSRIETGMTEISMVDLIHYMAFCGVLYDHAQDLLVEYREAERSRGYWLSPHGALLEDSLCSLIYHESTAAESISYEPQVVPGLLQTEAYARAMIGRDQWRTADNVESCVRARLDRQQVLHRRRGPHLADLPRQAHRD